MTEAQLDTWEKENSFISFRTVLKNAYKELEKITTDDQYMEFLKKYEDVLVLRDSTLTPLITIPNLQAKVNREGLYETSGFINKVVGDYIVTVKVGDFQKLRDLKSIDKTTRGDDEMSIFKFTEGEQIINARTNSACATFLSDYFFYNQTKCRDDREAYLSAQSYQETATDPTGTYYYPRVKFRVWGYYRNGWCNWNAYSTQYEYRNLSYSIWAWERVSVTPTGSTSVPKFYPIEPVPDKSIDDGSLSLF